jgi:hypothetical protein
MERIMANCVKGRILRGSRFILCVAALACHSEIFATISDAESCSKEELFREECDYQNAVQKRDCLQEQIAKIKECERKVAALDEQLVEKIKEKANEAKNSGK